jgi:hypothetical protein
METNGYKQATLAILLLALGCSKGSNAVKDGSVGSPEAGLATDGKTADGKAVDVALSDAGGVRLDAGQDQGLRDISGVDHAVVDIGLAVDARDAGEAGYATDAARDGADARDSSPDRSDVMDAPQIHDVGDDSVPALDAGIDSSPIGLGTCASPILVQVGAAQVDITVDTSLANHVLDATCASNGADIVLKLRVPTQQPQLVYADTFGASWNTVLFLSDTCDKSKPPTGAGSVVCSDDACGTSQSQVVAPLGLGYHYLIVSGVNGEGGVVTVHLQSTALGNGPLSVLSAGSGSLKGTTSGSDRSGICETSGPKDNYWWLSCPDYQGGAFSASTCLGATWDTALSLQVPRSGVMACNDDDNTCGMQSTIATTLDPGAGIHLLTVGGAAGSSMGAYTLSYTRP